MKLSKKFRRSILQAFLKDYNFALKYSEVLKIEHFDLIVEQIIFSKIKNFINTYHKLPKKADMEQLCIRDSKYEEELKPYIKKIYKKISSATIDYIKNELKNFCVYQQLKSAIEVSYNEYLPVGNYDKALYAINKSIEFSNSLDDIGSVFFDKKQINARLLRRQEDDTHSPFIRTGIHHLDAVIRGLKEGQTGVLCAPPKKGKSIFLINIGAMALTMRKTVFYYTTELYEPDIEDRFDSRLTGISMRELVKKTSTIKEKLKISKYSRGNLITKFFPIGTASVNDLRSHINKCEAMLDLVPDIIIIDYPTRLKAVMSFRGDRRAEIDSIYRDICNLSQELRKPIWLVHQGDRTSIKATDLDMDNTSETLEPARICDVFLTMQQTKLEKEAGLATIRVAGNRNGPSDFDIYVVRKPEIMLIKSIDSDDYYTRINEVKATLKRGKND